MTNTTVGNRKLPFNCSALCVSLVGGSLMLAVIWSLSYVGYISAEVAIWTTMVVFFIAAIYESFLLSLMARHMLGGVNKSQ
jgi:hypothetical protein